MGSITVKPSITKADLDNDRRNLGDLWNEALRAYQSILGTELGPTFHNVDQMITYGEEEMNKFDKWRRGNKKVEKLRNLFMGNISFIEEGAKQLIGAASPMFPPATAIGTAMTFVLSACKSQSADYDVVTAFFEDMNSFLHRVIIIAKRVPRQRAYQNALMDVFSSFLQMCAFAHKFIKQDRFKKWVINAFLGQDAELTGARKNMDTALSRLQSATEFAILDNSENMLGKQNDMLGKQNYMLRNQDVLLMKQREFNSMQNELRQNQELQQRLAASQSLMLETVLDRQNNVQGGIDDIKTLLLFMQQEKKEELKQGKTSQGKANQSEPNQSKNTRNRVRSALPSVPGVGTMLWRFEASSVEGTCKWIFDDPTWLSWTADCTSPPVLTISGPPGIGKSHVSTKVYDHFRQSARQDSDHTICTTYFSFQEDVEELSGFVYALISSLIQVSDQSASLRGQLEAELTREDADGDLEEVEDYWKLIVRLFGKASNYQLFMVLDGLDNLTTYPEWQALVDCMKSIKEQKLRIRVICTTRPRPTGDEITVPETEIQIKKEQIIPDVRKLVQDRMQNSDSTYRGLSRLTMYVKQRIARKLEQCADSLLYVEHMLRYLSGISREGAVIKVLENEMPATVSELYQMILKQCQRRISTELFPVMKSLLAWVSFCFRPLTLDEANALTFILSHNHELSVEDEALEAFSQFLKVGSTSYDVEGIAASPTGTAALFSALTPSGSRPMFDDGKLEVTFHERTMKEFFKGVTKTENSLRTPPTIAHRQIFIICCRLVNERKTSGPGEPARSEKLYEYAFKHCLAHWCRTDPSDHTDQENVEVCEAFTGLMMDGSFASGIEAMGPEFVIEGLLEDISEEFERTWAIWSKWVDKAPMKKHVDAATLEYWLGGPKTVLLPLARSHVTNWLSAADRSSASRSYRFARSAVKRTILENLLDENFEYDAEDDSDQPVVGAEENRSEEEILSLSQAFQHKLGSNAYYALGVLLDERGSQEAAVPRLERAIETCHNTAEEDRNYEELATVYLRMGQHEQAIRYSNLSLDASGDTSPAVRSKALLTKGQVQAELGLFRSATDSLAQARLCNPNIVKGGVLYDELIYHSKNKDWGPLMDTLNSLKPIERLHLFTYSYGWNEWMEDDVHVLMLAASTQCNNSDSLVAVYQEVIKALDAESAGAPLRINLAHVHWRLRNDISTAKLILNQVLDSSTEGEEYKLTGADPGDIAVRAINIMSDILFEEFRASKVASKKAELLSEATALTQSNLPQLAQITSSDLTPYQLTRAKMLKKMGPAAEYEMVMNQVFSTCMENLNDSVTWNDSINVYHLAMAVAQIPSLRTQAEILNSAQWYELEAELEEGSTTSEAEAAEDAIFSGQKELEPSDNAVNRIPAFDGVIKDIEGLMLDLDKNEKATMVTSDNVTLKDQHEDEPLENADEAVDEEQWDETAIQGSNLNYCKGQCFPRTDFDRWNEENPMYQCLVCVESILCQNCYETRTRWNKEGKPAKEPDFCCNEGTYLRGPAANWRGMRDGVIYFDPDPDDDNSDGPLTIEFREFLKTLEKAWKDAWEEFWEGY